MDLKTLNKHGKAVVLSAEIGIAPLWGNEVLLEEDMFWEVVRENQLNPHVRVTSNGDYELYFVFKGIKYFGYTSEEKYSVHFGQEKMTS